MLKNRNARGLNFTYVLEIKLVFKNKVVNVQGQNRGHQATMIVWSFLVVEFCS